MRAGGLLFLGWFLESGLEDDTDDLDDASVHESGKYGHLPFVTDGGIVVCEECGSFSI